MSKILLLTTGGTISGRPTDEGIAPSVTGAELSAALRGHVATEIVTEELFHLGSFALGAAEMATVAERVRTAFREGYHGVLVTHGTDTVADTAWLTHLIVGAHAVRVSFVSAMRNSAEIGSEGLRNLIDAARLVSDPKPSGVTLVANDEIHSAAWVRKVATSALQAFRSPGHAPVGDFFSGVPHLTRPTPLAPSWEADAVRVAPVGVVPTWDEQGATTIAALVDSGIGGVVLEGVGAGHMHPSSTEAIDYALEQGVPVVAVSRADGPIHDQYGGAPGSGQWVRSRPILRGGALGAARARLALGLGVATLPEAALNPWFDEVVAHQRGRVGQ